MKTILILSLLFLASCQKQSPSGVDPDYTDSLSEVRRGESCKKVNLLEDLVELENLRDLFVCTTWDKDFPQIFSALNDIEPLDWAFLAKPLNDHFFNNRLLRDQSINLLKELDRKGGLDELGKVITSLSDSNFFYHVNSLFECVNNEACRVRSGVTETDLMSFYEFFKADEELLDSLALLMRSFSTSLKGEGATFKKSLNENLKNKNFVEARNAFINELFLKMGDEDFLEELAFYENVLFQEFDGTRGWLPTYIAESLSKEEFNYLNRYPVDTQKNLWKDFRILRKTLEVTIGCKTDKGDPTFNVNISTHMKSFIDILFSSNQEEFFRNSLQSVAILKAANEVCPELRGYRDRIQGLGNGPTFFHEVNFVSMMELTTKLMLNEKYYAIVRQLHNSRPSEDKDDNTFLIEFFSKDIFTSYTEMLRSSTTGSTGLSSSLYDVIKSFPTSGYPPLKSLLDFVKNQDTEKLKSVAKVWEFLGEEGRYFFFNFLDSHYREEANLPLLFDFYAAMVLNARSVIPDILRDIIDPMRREEFFSSLRKVTGVLGRADLLEEYRLFFSREHILELIKVISSGSTSAIAGASLGSYVLEDVESKSPIRLSTSLVNDTVTKACLTQLVDENVTFYTLLNQLPQNCIPLSSEDPLFRLFDETSKMATAIGERRGIPKEFTSKGFFSRGMVTNVTQLLNTLSKSFSNDIVGMGEGEGLGTLLDELSVWLGRDGNKAIVIDTFRGLNIIGQKNHDLFGVFSRFYGQKENFDHLGNITKKISGLLNSYDRYDSGDFNGVLTPLSYEQDQRYVCENFHKNIGGKPCPEQKDIKTIISRIIERSLKKYDENPSALEQLIKMVSSDYGLPIPFESENPEYKRVTLEESFRMFYNFTNPDLKTNQVQLEYQPLPKADDEYFDNEDWKVKRKHTKDAPDEFETLVNTMERVEVVIRDVRFDENYLGAHYMNSVAKADDYNKVVDTKYGLLKTCIPLKFCGKFMNKGQHKFAKNSKDTFPALLDVNTKEGWEHGKYMQALLTSLVSSSSDKSQISTIVNKRIFGLNIQIPWLNAKKTLESHNGKILGLVSMVGMFTNSARVLRDRVGRSQEEFDRFLRSDRLKKADSGLLRNFKAEEHLEGVESLMSLLNESSALDDFLSFVYKSDYSTQRLWEQIVFKGVYMSSLMSDPEAMSEFSELERLRYQDLSLFDFVETLNVLVENYKNVTSKFDLGSKETLQNINHVLDVLMSEVESGDNSTLKFIHELALFIKLNKVEVNKNLSRLIQNNDSLDELKISVNSLRELLPKVVEGESNRLYEVFSLISESKNIDWAPFQEFLKVNGAQNLCSEETSGYYCRQNPEYREFQEILDYVLGKGAQGLSQILSYITGAKKSAINQFFTKVFPSINTTNY